MKTLVITFIIALVSRAARAELTYTTETGETFIQVSDARFGLTWKAPDGAVWSQYQGNFENNGSVGTEAINQNGDVAILDSAAVRACKAIGGELPSKEQYGDLLSRFGRTTDFQNIFPMPAQANNFAWTLNSHAGIPQFARYVRIAPSLDPYGDLTVNTQRYSVFCVRAR